MKRMTVRDFRLNVSKLQEPVIEVVRYSQTVGYYLSVEEYEKLVKKGAKKISSKF